MVSAGWAVAYGAYDLEERRARAAGAGAWAGTFERPADWRGTHGGRVESPHDILRRLATQPGETVTRKDIIDAVRHHTKKAINDRTIDVHIRAIRKKIPEMQKHLTSVYGVGYRYDK